MENTLLFIAYKEPTIENGKVIEPASLVRFEQVNESAVIAKVIQRYARPNNKQFEKGTYTLESFNGKFGFSNDFYTENDIVECLKMLTNEGYKTRRMTVNKMNELADNVFKAMYSFNMRNQIDKYGMKLPS